MSIQDYLEQETKKYSSIISSSGKQQVAITIPNKIFTSTCDFTGHFTGELEFMNCFFLNTIFFHHCKFLERISFKHCFCDTGLRIHSNAEFLKDFDLIVFSAKSPVYVDGGTFNDCKWSIVDNGIVNIDGGVYNSLNIGYWGGVVLKELSFHFPKVKGAIKVTNDRSKIERLDLFQYSSDLSISIEDISVNSISIYKYRNEKSLRLSSIKGFESDKSSEFSIVESYLGKAEFYSLDFDRLRQ